MRRIETILIDAGETQTFRVLTMSTRPPHRTIKARVVRNRHWLKIMAVVRAVDAADRNFPHDQNEPRLALEALRVALGEGQP